jgi:hypothetical protein
VSWSLSARRSGGMSFRLAVLLLAIGLPFLVRRREWYAKPVLTK